MASPVGHTLFGIAVSTFWGRRLPVHQWILRMMIILFANLPDIDYLFGVFTGDPNQYHRLWTHSLGFLVLSGIVIFILCKFQKTKNTYMWTGFTVLLVLSHLFIDYLGMDTSSLAGIPLFWPVSNTFYISPVTIFSEIYKGTDNGNFIRGLFCMHNMWTILKEIIILGTVAAASLLMKKRRIQETSTACAD